LLLSRALQLKQKLTEWRCLLSLSLFLVLFFATKVAALVGGHQQEVDRVVREATELAAFLAAQGCGLETAALACLNELGVER
jgi:hypothetical protein